jgi:ubiquinone/menaquinone biosynthesis C-methylase UbiE
MPTSDPATVGPMQRAITLLMEQTHERPLRILDCGVGAGWVGRTVRAMGLTEGIQLDGIEIYEPYLTKSEVRHKMEVSVGVFHHLYDKIVLGDFTKLLAAAEDRSAHIVIFGDSLEHVEPEQAKKTLLRARRVTKLGVIVNAPIVNYPQGELLGNIHERHLLQWPRQTWERHGGIHLGGNETVGCFVYLPLP